MNTEDNNKLIAEFMGYPNISNDEDKRDYLEDYVKYHKSWDWLMPVVDKIENYLSDNVGKVGYFDECLSSNDLEVRYQAVVEFINQYNKTK
jgi:hypothetical protein